MVLKFESYTSNKNVAILEFQRAVKHLEHLYGKDWF